MENGSYFSRSWRMLTRNKGWYKPLLVMSAATLVPVAGVLGNDGYALEWARLSAWGVDSSPKQRNVQVGKCIESGWRGFVAGIGWTLAFSVVSSMVTGMVGILPGAFGDLLAGLVSIVASLLSVFVALVAKVASVRATIYQKISAGYRPEALWEMIRRDKDGFLGIFFANLLCMVVVAAMAMVMAIVIVAELFPFLMQLDGAIDEVEVIRAIATAIVPLMLTCTLFGYAMGFVGNAVDLLVTNAVGLWMRQFDVASWGRSEDPLPQANPYAWEGWQQEPVQQSYYDDEGYVSVPTWVATDEALGNDQGAGDAEPDQAYAYDIPLVPADVDYAMPAEEDVFAEADGLEEQIPPAGMTDAWDGSDASGGVDPAGEADE